MAVLPDEIDQTLLAEFTVVVLGFSHPIAIRQENIAFRKLYDTFFVADFAEEANYGTSAIQSTDSSTAAENDRREMTGIRVGKRVLASIVKSQEHGRGFFGRRALVKLMIKQCQ